MNKLNQHRSKNGKNRLILFKATAILSPIMLLLLLEIGLRILGYGCDLSLFIDDAKNKGYLVMNPNASKRYFTDEENATIGTFEPFEKHKTAGTYRIFVLGESTTLGYPYMHNASFHRWLLYRYMHTFPDRKFEIINLSLTAVNSYTVWGFAKEIINYQPDAVLIYCGQNEYYGTLGVASTSQLGGNRTIIKSLLYLRSFRLVQLMGNSYSHLRRMLAHNNVDTRETLMKRMASKQEIPFNSEIYKRGIQQFQSNMEAVCKILSDRKIPVFISNLVSNEKDLPPFISSEKDTANSATYQYSLAETAFKNGYFAKAKTLYIKAKDLDMLRFRAPETLNTVISELPQKYPDVFLVDTRKVFEANSPHEIIGKETILEHVHPTIFGYGLMSEAFYQTIKQHHCLSQTWDNEISFEQLQREMPITKVDSLKGTYEIQELKEAWPFNQEKTLDFDRLNSFEDKLAVALLRYKISWNDAIQKQMNFYLSHTDGVNATRVAEAAALEFSNDATFLNYAGKFCMNLHEYHKAMVYYLHSFRLVKDFGTAQSLAILFLKKDEPHKALIYLDYLAKNNHSKVNYSIAQSLTTEVMNDKTKLSVDSLNVPLLNQIALNYYKMQNIEVALKYAEKAFELDKRNNSTIELLRKIKTPTGNKTNQ